MTKRMLIDATHSEETRVAIVDDNRLEEFEYESTFRRPLKGNIFLAKITRVEPSLQAAFVNFGGNRHGFLPFSEIHPDYFRIPVADREAFLEEQQREIEEHDKRAREAEEAAAAAADAVEVEAEAELEADVENDVIEGEVVETSDEAVEEEKPKKRGRPKKAAAKKVEIVEVTEEVSPEDVAEADESDVDGNVVEAEAEDVDGNGAEQAQEDEDGNTKTRGRGGRGRRNYGGRGGRGGNRGGNRGRGRRRNYDNEDDETRFRFSLRRKYKIQEVIKRGQIMLIQVSKEERGNKGAAVSTYLSLPGRYCVLMPNSPRGGGVSRKVASYKDRNKMKDLLKELKTPQGMSTIVRTAGVSRTKTEVKRDLDYLMRLWDNIRSLTLESSAPALVYEEANLIKRAVRDLYSRDVEEVLVAGEAGYKTAKDFMKLMVPSHAKRVKEYDGGNIPLFSRYQIEGQIHDIGEVEVTLPSGGYLVINPTEALVSVDVNSGRSTKERHIEGTALKTNLEAAEEVARQLRLRDLGGLVVIDFIDMEDRRNNGKVERKMRDALSGDRARVQCGRISSFGLMELSRQRLNPSLSESQFELCPKCEGRGRVRTADAQSILVLRALEEEGARARAAEVIVHVSNDVALYILNHKRGHLADLELRYNFTILIRVDDEMGAQTHRVEVSKPVSKDQDDNEGDTADSAQEPSKAKAKAEPEVGAKDEEKTPRRRRGRRGGRGRNRDRDDSQENTAEVEAESSVKAEEKPEEKADAVKEEKPKRGRRKKADAEADKSSEAVEAKEEKEEKPKQEKPKKAPAKKKPAKKDEPAEKTPVEATAPKAQDNEPSEASKHEVVNEPPAKKKKGWWSR